MFATRSSNALGTHRTERYFSSATFVIPGALSQTEGGTVLNQFGDWTDRAELLETDGVV